MYIIITASPNKDGLTNACGKAAYKGITDAGAEAEIIDLCTTTDVKPCKVCGTSTLVFDIVDKGWGSCFGKAVCVIKDSMAELQEKIRAAKGLILVSPVYFGQPSEPMQYFMDRFRRLEVFNDNGSAAKNKVVDMIAAAGGSGNGTVPCLSEMEEWCRQVGGLPKERLGISRYNREAMLQEITASASRMVKEDFFGVWLTKEKEEE